VQCSAGSLSVQLLILLPLQDMGINTQESCTTYNMLKVTRSLFCWSGSSRYADFYERALTNGVLGIARMPALQLAEGAANVPGTEQHT
jgi:hypothetical protein